MKQDGKLFIPFANGDMLASADSFDVGPKARTYRHGRHGKPSGTFPLVWREAIGFYAMLRLDRIEAPRAAATAFWLDTSGNEYPMMLRFLDETIKNRVIAHGAVNGWWAYYQRGGSYSIKPIIDGARA